MAKSAMDMVCWYLIYTRPKQEDRADVNLRSWRVETLFPKVKDKRYNEFTGKLSPIIKPLFPRYLFARFSLEKFYHKVRFTRGVQDLVAFGDKPTQVNDEIIELIKSRIREDGLLRQQSDLSIGDEVRISHGPLRNLAGILEQEIPAPERVRILLTTISFQAHVVLNRDFVQKVGP